LGGGILGRIAQVAIQVMGWEIDSHEVSRRLPCPEIILQSGQSEALQQQDRERFRRVGFDLNYNSCVQMGSKDEIKMMECYPLFLPWVIPLTA